MVKLWLPVLVAIALSLCGCMTKDVASGLSEEDARQIMVVLKGGGLEADSVRAGGDRNSAPTWTVTVRGGEQNAVLAWRILQENGLPRQKVKGLDEVFSSVGMIPTASEEKARLLMALSGELSRTLESIQGVVDARVQVVLPDNSPLLDKSQWSQPTSSVLLKYRGSQLPLTEDEVKKLVARGVEGLQAENVAVVFKRTEPVQPLQRDVTWYMGDQRIVVASLFLMLLASAGSLVLVFRGRRNRATIAKLQLQIKDLSKRPELSA